MDARRGQFYTALFRDGARITEDSALGLAEITEMLHGLENVTVCGDGAGVFRTLCGEMPGVVYAAPAACDQNALSDIYSFIKIIPASGVCYPIMRFIGVLRFFGGSSPIETAM